MIEIRWHARAGQGAKTAAQLYAEAMLHAGNSAQAFPEYGPERRGAPMRAYTRVDRRPIRRHDSVEHPDVVVVLEPTLVHEGDVAAGLAEEGFVVVNAEQPPAALAGRDVRCVPAARIAARDGSGFVNVVMLGALAGALHDPPLADLQEAAVEHLGGTADPDALRRAVEEGYRCLS
jgi:pyruvate ferredoxin oxidoreductase gamma subunit